MKRKLFTLLFVAAMYTPANADSIVPDDPGTKTQQHFEIATIDGYREVYAPGEEIAFYVSGNSPVQIAAEPASGFHVQATVLAQGQNSAVAGYNGTYDEDKHSWLVTFPAPSDTAKSYQLVISLYCSTETGPCVDVYGTATQITKTLSLQVR